MVPQIIGGALPLGPVSEKVSVRHWVAWATTFPAAEATLPPTSYVVVEMSVEGPVMTKVLKSSRI